MLLLWLLLHNIHKLKEILLEPASKPATHNSKGAVRNFNDDEGEESGTDIGRPRGIIKAMQALKNEKESLAESYRLIAEESR